MKILFLSMPTCAYWPQGAVSVHERLGLTVATLRSSGHSCDIVATEGSCEEPGVIIVPGKLHPNGQKVSRFEFFINPESAMTSMFEYAREHQNDYDIIVSLGHDYMGYFIQPYFTTPFVLIPNMVTTLVEVETLIAQRYRENPSCVGFLTQSQKHKILGSLCHSCLEEPAPHKGHSYLWAPMDTEQYHASSDKYSEHLFWAGRVMHGKGLHNVVEVCKRLNKKLLVAGEMVDGEYFTQVSKHWDVSYLGVLNRSQLSYHMARSEVFFQLQEPEFIEAFGRITAEALLSGTPVVAFDNGANKELVQHGIDGFIVSDINHAVLAFEQARQLDGQEIFKRARHNFHPSRHAQNLLHWFDQVIGQQF